MNRGFEALTPLQKRVTRGIKMLVLVLAVQEAGWMAFDGGRALIVGDYVTPSSGPYAGQVGPWARVVQAVGIPPRSTVMKTIFLVYGVAWLAIAVAFVGHVHGSWAWMIAAAAGALWYLPVGTTSSVIQIPLLLWLRRRLAWR